MPPLRGGPSLSQPSLSQPPPHPDGRERAQEALDRISPSSPGRKGGRPGEEGRAPMRGSTEGQRTGDAEAYNPVQASRGGEENAATETTLRRRRAPVRQGRLPLRTHGRAVGAGGDHPRVEHGVHRRHGGERGVAGLAGGSRRHGGRFAGGGRGLRSVPLGPASWGGGAGGPL